MKKQRKPYQHPHAITDNERKIVIEAYMNRSDNRIKAIAEETGLNYHRVDKIVEDHLKTPKQV